MGFTASFGREPSWRVWAPGRVNLIGEHTDYNGGHVLPAAIGLGIEILASPREDGELRIDSDQDGRRYLEGARTILAEAGAAVPGADLWIGGDLPVGAGLSSSAALTAGSLALFAALDRCAAGQSTLVGTPRERGVPEARRDSLPGFMTPLELARLAREVEHRFAGVRCGIMDPLAILAGRKGKLLHVDCAAETWTEIPFPWTRARLAVLDSGLRRELADGRYNALRSACESAAAKLAGRPGIPLAAIDASAFERGKRRLAAGERDAATHVIGEELRTAAFVRHISAGDLAAAGAVLREGHASLRDVLKVSLPELDRLVRLAGSHPACFGARLTGAGFGGCVLALVSREGAASFLHAIGGDRGWIVEPDDGVRVERVG